MQIKTTLFALGMLLLSAASVVAAQEGVSQKITKWKAQSAGVADPAMRHAAVHQADDTITKVVQIRAVNHRSDFQLVDPLPKLESCNKRPPPAPYDQPYTNLNSSGTLDVKLVTDNVIGSIRDFQKMMDDLQARTEQLRCEQANGKALLRSLGHPAGDCSLGPPTSYDTSIFPRVSDGFPDITAVIATTNMYHHNAADVLGDLQARLQRLHCEQTTSIRLSGDLLAQNASVFTRAVTLQPCTRLPAAPSYVQHYIRELASGVMDHKMAINALSGNQESVEGWLDDIQSQVEQIGCEQSNVKAQMSATIKARTKASQLLTKPKLDSSRVFVQDNPKPPALTERVRHAGKNGHTSGQNAIAEVARRDRVTLETKPPSSPPKPADQDCSKVRPDPSYVHEVRHWSCSTAEACTVYDEFTMNLVGDMRRDIEAAADDLQVRVGRLVCQQRNINGQLAFLRRAW